jgi:hypothetical protein
MSSLWFPTHVTFSAELYLRRFYSSWWVLAIMILGYYLTGVFSMIPGSAKAALI